MFTHVKFVELPVLNQDRAIAFYRDKAELVVRQDAPYSDGWRWIEMEIPDARTRVVFVKAVPGDIRDTPRLVLVSDDIDSIYRKLGSRGVEFTVPPRAAEWDPKERYALFRDSEGNIVMVGEG